MADFALIVTDDSERRRRFLEQARESVQRIPGLVVQQLRSGNFAAVWARSSQAPGEFESSHEHASIFLGYGVDDDGKHVGASDLRERWLHRSSNRATFDGYFAGVTWSAERGLVAGVDPLGIFPIYFVHQDETLVVASTPHLCSLHPTLRAQPDPQALASILLFNGLTGNRSLVAGVRRLAIGHHLVAKDVQHCVEVEHWRPEHASRFVGRELAELKEEARSRLLDAIERHRPVDRTVPTTIMLSGGCDSRLMAGYLQERQLISTAVTLGRESDFESRAARQVCRALNLAMHRSDSEPDARGFVEAGRRVARDERLTGGFSALGTEAEAVAVGEVAPYFWSGFALDDVLGGYAHRYNRDRASGRRAFDVFADRCNKWGLPRRQLETSFVSPDAAEWVETSYRDLQDDYERGGETIDQRAFLSKLNNRVRHYIGAILHRLSFRSWPLLPAFDRRVVQMMYNVELSIVDDRRLELAMLVQDFPTLAEIPLDSNSFRFEPARPLDASAPMAKIHRAWRSLARDVRKWYWRGFRGVDPRRYQRIFDFNSSNWRAVRNEAARHREVLAEWFTPQALDELLPAAENTVVTRLPFSQTASMRNLLGLTLCLADASAWGRSSLSIAESTLPAPPKLLAHRKGWIASQPSRRAA
jgi:asparagine synthase (glutamine-hydrolysing)